MPSKLFIPPITKQAHFIYGITGHGVISTLCGAALQHGSTRNGDEWSNHVNYWGKVGIKKHRPFTHLTLDPAAVTCRRCLPLVPKVKEVEGGK
jgi:hypothetical protein